MATVPEVPVYLTEIERRVVRLRDLEGMKWVEIGRKLGMARQNVMTAYQRAKARMMEHGPAPVQALQEACEKAFELVEGKIDDKLLGAMAEEVAWQAAWQMLNNSALWPRASVRELSTVYGQMIEKRQLLRGEPTQITKIQDIRELDE